MKPRHFLALTTHPLRARVELTGRHTLPNEGRITGSSQLSVFDYRVRGLGIAAICLRPDPIPDDPGILGFPDGTPPYYVLTTIVGVPQAPVRAGEVGQRR